MHSREHRIYRVSSGKILHKQAPIRKQKQQQQQTVGESDTRVERMYYLKYLVFHKNSEKCKETGKYGAYTRNKKEPAENVLEKLQSMGLVVKEFRSTIINGINSKN